MDEPGGHYVKWNKLDTERQILHGLTYKESKNVEFIKAESRTVVAGAVGKMGEMLVEGYKF